MTTTLFSRILSGELPSYQVYADSLVVAILDAAPLAPGHLLLIPRQPVAFLHQLPAVVAGHCGQLLVKLGGALVDAGLAQDYNILQNNGALAGQTVPHVHFHLIPRPSLKLGLKLGWQSQKLDATTNQQLVSKLQHAMSLATADEA